MSPESVLFRVVKLDWLSVGRRREVLFFSGSPVDGAPADYVGVGTHGSPVLLPSTSPALSGPGPVVSGERARLSFGRLGAVD